jgi:hypothetical protein
LSDQRSLGENMSERLSRERAMSDVKEVSYQANLPFGRGRIGEADPLRTDQERAAFGADLRRHTRPLTVTNTADCGDERRTLRLANGVDDPRMLRERVVQQLFGGLGIATTKAASAANAAYLRDAKNFTDAYEKTVALLVTLGYSEGGHEGCGASAGVESSVATTIDLRPLSEATSLFTGITAKHPDELKHQDTVLADLGTHKQRLLEAGYYGAWDVDWHANFVSEGFSGNFSYLAGDPNDLVTHGHHAQGIYAVTEPNFGFAKNEMIEATGQESFAVTAYTMADIANKLGGSAEERERIRYGFYDDTLHVGNGLVTLGMPVFA